MTLDEADIRAKVIELLDRMNDQRMNMWLISGITAQVVDADLAMRVMAQEIPKRSQHVQEYWLQQPCNCNGALN